MLKQIVANFESRGGETETVQLSCPYCHQGIVAKATAEILNNKDLRRDLAIESCTCSTAKEITKRKEKVENLDINLCNLIGEKSADPIDEGIYIAVRELAKAVSFGNACRASIYLNRREKIMISCDAKGITKINRKKEESTVKTI